MPPGFVRAFKELKGDAGKKWNELLGLLAARGVNLIPEDADRLREYCEAFDLRCRAVKELEGQPLILTSPNGAAYTNPLTKVVKQCEATMHKISGMYGLDLKARAGKGDMQPKAGNKLMDFIMKRGEFAKPACHEVNTNGSSPPAPRADE